jgi:hypothetical protein
MPTSFGLFWRPCLLLYEDVSYGVQAEASTSREVGKGLSRPRFSGIGHVYAGLSDEELEVCCSASLSMGSLQQPSSGYGTMSRPLCP